MRVQPAEDGAVRRTQRLHERLARALVRVDTVAVVAWSVRVGEGYLIVPEQ